MPRHVLEMTMQQRLRYEAQAFFDACQVPAARASAGTRVARAVLWESGLPMATIAPGSGPVNTCQRTQHPNLRRMH